MLVLGIVIGLFVGAAVGVGFMALIQGANCDKPNEQQSNSKNTK